MNERIRKLALQCWENRPEGQLHFDNEKFALLIVRECMSLMDAEKEYCSKPGMYESREYYERMRAKEDAFEDAASIIKSHFGVE
jgi:hypothetical protein